VEIAPLNYAGPRTPRIVREPPTWVTGGVVLLMLYGFGHLAFKVMMSDRDHRNVSKHAAAKTDLTTLEKAIGVFKMDMGRPPTHTEGLKALVVPPFEAEAWSGPYVKRGIPSDPWGNAYVYHRARPRGVKAYTLLSRGPDGVEGTADDVVD
jgi:type II secretion system protein G